MTNNIGIVSVARTAVGSFGGSLKSFQAVELAAMAVGEAVARSGLPPAQVGEVVLGCVGQYGRNIFLGRLAGQLAGLPVESTGQTVNRMCASGLQAIVTAAGMIAQGDCDVAVAGGAESMSNYPHSLPGARWGLRMGDGALRDDLMTALMEPFTGTHIGITAENVAERYGLTREELDAWALESQRRALAAIAKGSFREEIFPVEVKDKKGSFIFDTDEYPRETTLEKLARLRPAFRPEGGVVTAGNASGINDGACALVLVNTDKVDAKPLARLVDYTVAGVDPAYMGMGPVPAIQKLLEKTGMTLPDIGLFELNEAFAAQALACVRELKLDPGIVNVGGSGISLGHPIGATGAIISVKLIQEMRRRGVRYGIAALCIGGGQGMAALYEVI